MGHTRLAGFFKRYLLIEHVAGNHPCARRAMAADPASFSAAPIHKMPGGDAKPGLLCFNGHHVFVVYMAHSAIVFSIPTYGIVTCSTISLLAAAICLGDWRRFLSSQVSCLEPPTLTTTDSTCILPQTWALRCIFKFSDWDVQLFVVRLHANLLSACPPVLSKYRSTHEHIFSTCRAQRP